MADKVSVLPKLCSADTLIPRHAVCWDTESIIRDKTEYQHQFWDMFSQMLKTFSVRSAPLTMPIFSFGGCRSYWAEVVRTQIQKTSNNEIHLTYEDPTKTAQRAARANSAEGKNYSAHWMKVSKIWLIRPNWFLFLTDPWFIPLCFNRNIKTPKKILAIWEAMDEKEAS